MLLVRRSSTCGEASGLGGMVAGAPPSVYTDASQLASYTDASTGQVGPSLTLLPASTLGTAMTGWVAHAAANLLPIDNPRIAQYFDALQYGGRREGRASCGRGTDLKLDEKCCCCCWALRRCSGIR